jgi:Domain of Unknown Function (DUF1080)
MHRLSAVRLSVALSVIFVLMVGAVARADTDPALQGKLLARSDGTYFVYQDGYKVPITLADIGDDAINAIPDGPPPPPTPPVAQPSPAVAPAPKPGDVLYQADWSQGMDGWTGPSHWKTVGGMLVNDGGDASSAWAAFQTPNPDYAVEAEMQAVGQIDNTYSHWAVGVRGDASSGTIAYYSGGTHSGHAGISDGNLESMIVQKTFTPRNDWHKYRLEAKGNHLKLFIDGALVVESDDNRHLTGSEVGLYSRDVQVNVRSFKVIQL